MEATPTPHPSAPTTPARRRKRPHPAHQARKTAAMVSVGSFLALTGAFAAKSALAPAPATTGTSGTTGSAVVTTDDGGLVVITPGSSTGVATDDWSGTSSSDTGTASGSNPTTNTVPATTQSHGS